ncbi:hypothetical protein OG453_25360 [Streptomyces sp. NBC_01381]|uniref:hypothetical protein n=1 Tax=Streptomyces sp. NBC_01381 TaxID=2903845 RepID=UPI002253345F|nr:hypothetical protein [Streptomyces sp. NBC_01381]MCX4669977.1 hypothetical protein [Streptomyces sp. NBC_01381]
MALSDKDPYNAREGARIIVLAARAARLEGRGKSNKRVLQQAARIRELAQEREDAKAAARAAARKKRHGR